MDDLYDPSGPVADSSARFGFGPPTSPSDAVTFAAAFEAALFGLVITDSRLPDNPIVRVNPAFTAMTGYRADEVMGRNCRFLQGPDTDAADIAALREAIAEARPIRRTLLNYRRDGAPYWVEISLTPVRQDDGELVGFAAFQIDVSEQRRRQEQSRDIERRLQSLADNMPGFLFQRARNPDGRVALLYCSPSLNRLLGLPPSVLSWPQLQAHVHPEDAARFGDSLFGSTDRSPQSLVTYRMITAAGEDLWIKGAATARMAAGGVVIWDGWGLDITNEKRAHRRLAYLAEYDPLTGLANRGNFERIVGAAIERFDPRIERVVLHSVEIGEWEEIREALGADVAEALMTAVADRLAAFAGPTGRAARTGETQFGILEIRSAAALEETGRRLHAAMAQPLLREGRELKIQPDIGLVSYPSDAGDRAPLQATALELIKRSDIARLESKRVRPGHPVLYSREIDDRISTRVKLRQSLHRAIAQREFELHYQPLVTLGDGRIVGAEALVRWNHPEFGLQRPDIFIPIAEESGLIVPLGEWVLENAMLQARRWQAPAFGAPRVAVNVSGVQLHRSDFAATVARLLASTGVDPSRIELELTEGFLIGTSPKLIATLMRIRSLGVDLVIDDFGTGYSSFQYLEHLPIDKLKIDQSFIRNMTIDRATIVRAMIEMARSLKLNVVCEGIETLQQWEFLTQQGCKVGQGFLFSVPVTAPDFESLLIDRRAGLRPVAPS